MDTIKTFQEKMRELSLVHREQFGPLNSYHEASAIIREKFEEFWDIVKQNNCERDPVEALVDIATSCWIAAEDLGLVKVDSMSEEVRQKLHTKRQEKIEDTLAKIHNRMLDGTSFGGSIHTVKVPPMQRQNIATPEYALRFDNDLMNEINEALRE
jgi:hypothetical protein